MKKQISFLAIIFMFITWGGYTQELDTQVTPKLTFDKSGHVRYIKFDGKNKTGKWDSPSTPKGFFKNVLNANEQDEFILKNRNERDNGSYYEHYSQFYKGVEVEGGLFILHFKNGKLTKANGHYVNTTGVNPTPRLTPSQAAQSYGSYLNLSNVSTPKFLHGIVITEIETISGTDTTYNAKLCYKIGLIGNISTSETAYIDAQNGKVLKTQQNWYNTSETGTFATLYSGSKSAGTQFYNGEYNLIDSSRNAIICQATPRNHFIINSIIQTKTFCNFNRN